MSEKKTVLWELPEPSTARVSPFVLTRLRGGTLEIRVDYDRDGDAFNIGVRFDAVRAFRFRAELYATPWQIRDAYDSLVEVLPSAWVSELRADAPSTSRDEWVMRHFMITIDGAGCYEAIARDFSISPEEDGPLVDG